MRPPANTLANKVDNCSDLLQRPIIIFGKLFKVSPLLNKDFVFSLGESIDGQFAQKGFTGTALMSYLESGGNWETLSEEDRNMMGCFLTYHDVPFPGGMVDDTSDLLNDVVAGNM